VQTESPFAPSSQLRQRHRVLSATAQIDYARFVGIRQGELFFEQRKQVAGMKTIPALVPGAVEPDVAQGSAAQAGVDPELENTLLGMSELARAGQDPTAIDPDGKIKRVPIFQCDRLGRDFRRAVEGDWWRR